jgi:RNA polymerase sigma-70 factor (ECF subfamily)
VPAASEPPSLDELVRSARSGSPDAWEGIYRAARPQLFRFARLRLVTDDQAEDAVSETLVRAIAAIDRFPAGTRPMAWMMGICRNVVHETHRSGARHRRPVPDREGSVPVSPDEHVLAVQEIDQLRRCFDGLNAEEQELLALRVVGGLDAESVAAVVGKRAGAVRMAQSRALARLRGCMEEDA